MIHEAVPSTEKTVNAQFLNWKKVSRSDIIVVYVHDIEPKVNTLALINLVRHSVVQNRSVVALVLQFTRV